MTVLRCSIIILKFTRTFMYGQVTNALFYSFNHLFQYRCKTSVRCSISAYANIYAVVTKHTFLSFFCKPLTLISFPFCFFPFSIFPFVKERELLKGGREREKRKEQREKYYLSCRKRLISLNGKTIFS